jgi:NAD(P)-dependent dehydrogenase (short-subunit alcohol dehydrogenase family)
MMDLGLEGKRAVLTGGSKGIGLAVARRLATEGVDVVVGSRRSSDELDVLCKEGHVVHVGVDLSGDEGPSQLVNEALRVGPIDILINNAGAVTPRLGGFTSVTDEQWSTTMALTFMAAVRTARAVLPHLIARGSGSIVNNASVNSILPDPLVIDYGAAKAALINFSKALSKEVGRHGIRVNAVSAGPVSTELWLGGGGVAATLSGAQGSNPDDVARNAVKDTATGRFTTPEEAADLIVFLASSRASNVTGANYLVDGGLYQGL